MTQYSDEQFQDIRDSVKALCAGFPNEYYRKVDDARAYPEALVDTLTKERWMYQVAPISTNLILSYVAEHVLGLPRSS